jgi:ATP-dependent DNA ligase
LRDEAPTGERWAHEIKLDGYRIHARIDGRDVRLLTRTGLDWTDRYLDTAAALGRLKAREAYIDGELCALDDKGLSSFAAMQAATDHRASDELDILSGAEIDDEHMVGVALDQAFEHHRHLGAATAVEAAMEDG